MEADMVAAGQVVVIACVGLLLLLLGVYLWAKQ